MALEFEFSGRINKPVDEVFEAIVNPEQLSAYFTTGGAKGRIEAGASPEWGFADFPTRFPVHIREVEENRRIVFDWQSNDSMQGHSDPYDTRVTFTFQPLEDGRTLVTISETGWKDTESGQHASYSNCSGWAMMLSAMKAWLEHGIFIGDRMHS